MEKENLEALYEVVLDRKKNGEEGSYTKYLFDKGLDKILKKVGEECTEVVIASKNENQEELVGEICDLAYHVLVLMAEREVPMEAIKEELGKRRAKINNFKGERREIKNV